MNTTLASFTPSLMDLFLLYADPIKANAVLGAILAAVLLFYGAIYVYLKYFAK